MKINKNNHAFTIAFTFLFTIILVFPLSIAYVGTKPIADNYWRVQHFVKTLKSLGIEADASKPDEAKQAYSALKKYSLDLDALNSVGKAIDFAALSKLGASLPLKEIGDDVINKALEDSSYTGNLPVFFYATKVGDEIRIAGDFTGPGLWGNVSIALGMTGDAQTILGFQALFNVETPGLGARITEPWFSAQFTQKVPGSGLVYNLSGQKLPNGIDAIAGATITSDAVKKIINDKALPLLRDLAQRLGGTL